MLSNTIVSSLTGNILATFTVGITWLGVLSVVALIILLSLKELLKVSKSWNKYLSYSSEMIISPLIAFFAIVIFKVMEIKYV
ncbi:MAG TPA: hypothetical protein VJJ51_02435 [Candidatus Methanoperedens sp.]|nr:hypothetical protein [Candidatus Methanoperedens sp.]HLB69882.1 hypothetical protein [Candidatus Methanoperedens sp.]